MTIYKNQLSTTIPFDEFIGEYDTDTALNALHALREYEGVLPRDYDDYLIFHVGYEEDNTIIWAITRITDEWQPVEVNDRVRKFTKKHIYNYDSHMHIEVD